MNRSMIIFGDMHLHYNALEVVLNEARKMGINTALNLGSAAVAILPI